MEKLFEVRGRLEVFAILERDNPVVYEKLGSAYYMMNDKQKPSIHGPQIILIQIMYNSKK